ncbi:MAG: Asp-tRNA(Asn)/Glu-tRNA(Gln) amidotransferase subunit GatA [Candidatus Omnitrophica bacterium]|nr:Asp-tRNA(Asn)/Glu-tRNA(Gln) amidotransferase subunit GatA [Candidatus Omnitrophota bacterium]
MELFKYGIKQAREFIQANNEHFLALQRALVERAGTVDKKVNAYVSFSSSKLPTSLNQLSGGPLHGVPVSLKDNMCTDGWETTCASNILQGFIPPYDATVISKLKDAGAYIFAKCDMDEFAFGSSCETSCYNGRNNRKKKANASATRNPWNVDYIPGGSSGGSAACVAADEAVCSLGSDTGGSIRQPAALCGVVGLKPTYGRVSRYGLVAFGSSLDQIGPFTKTVYDNALLLQVIAGHDPKDSTSAHEPVDDYLATINKGVKDLRIGIPKEYFRFKIREDMPEKELMGNEGLDYDVELRIREAIKVYQNLGAKIVDISLPHTKYAVAVYYIIGTAEASSNLARFDGVQYGLRVYADNLREMYFKTRDEGFGDEAKRRILLGTFVLSSGYYDAYYKKAQKVRTLIKQDFDNAFQQCDVILTPTSPTPAFKIGEKLDDPISMYLSDIFTISANLAGIPALSVPCGFSKNGLPIGMQLMGKYFSEATLFQAAHTFESATDHHTKRPAL